MRRLLGLVVGVGAGEEKEEEEDDTVLRQTLTLGPSFRQSPRTWAPLP